MNRVAWDPGSGSFSINHRLPVVRWNLVPHYIVGNRCQFGIPGAAPVVTWSVAMISFCGISAGPPVIQKMGSVRGVVSASFSINHGKGKRLTGEEHVVPFSINHGKGKDSPFVRWKTPFGDDGCPIISVGNRVSIWDLLFPRLRPLGPGGPRLGPVQSVNDGASGSRRTGPVQSVNELRERLGAVPLDLASQFPSAPSSVD